jgi:hypothetical protein
MDSKEIRHANFIALFNQFKRENAHLPDRGMLKLFAQKLELSDRFLSHVKCRRKVIGDQVARHIEDKLQLRHGWLDQQHENVSPAEEAEKVFLDTALTLYRAMPDEAQKLMMELLKSRLPPKPPKKS